MGRRAAVPTAPSPFKYAGDLNANIRPHEQCETSEPDGCHEVHPTSWPPARIGNQVGDPSMSLQCVLCGCNVIVYAKHARADMDGVRVVLPEGKKAKQPA